MCRKIPGIKAKSPPLFEVYLLSSYYSMLSRSLFLEPYLSERL